MGKIYLGSDHAGLELKQVLTDHLTEQGLQYEDLGPFNNKSCHYPEYAAAVCKAVLENQALGLLICGTGLGMSMTANKFPGIRAALCLNEYMATMSREHNNSNVLCLGARVIGTDLALSILKSFLSSKFQGGRHAQRVEMMESLSQGYRSK